MPFLKKSFIETYPKFFTYIILLMIVIQQNNIRNQIVKINQTKFQEDNSYVDSNKNFEVLYPFYISTAQREFFLHSFITSI